MKNEIKHEFIASSKVIRYKLDAKAADILAVLVYKNQYWKGERKLININGRKGFHISVDNIREETCFGKDVIQKRIKLLEREGLIEYRRQGLTKPNIYFIDESKIDKYIKDHKEEYERWRLSIREIKVVVSPMDTLKDENTTSRKGNSSFLEYDETVTTNNKKTNNKKIKTLTNHINVVDYDDDKWIDYSLELEEMIDKLRTCDNDIDRNGIIEDIYEFLGKVVSKFKCFTMSEEDKKLIEEIKNEAVNSYIIAGKIITNAKAICDKRKESRFGSLFVGVKQIYKENELYN